MSRFTKLEIEKYVNNKKKIFEIRSQKPYLDDERSHSFLFSYLRFLNHHALSRCHRAFFLIYVTNMRKIQLSLSNICLASIAQVRKQLISSAVFVQLPFTLLRLLNSHSFRFSLSPIK